MHVDAVRDDLETLVLDADLLEAVLGTPDPKKKAKEIEIKVARRLRKHLHDPRFKALAERLEDLKQRHEQGLLAERRVPEGTARPGAATSSRPSETRRRSRKKSAARPR